MALSSKIFSALLALFLLVSTARGQTYTVGDTINNFSLEICENGEGTWDYHTNGTGNIVWMNLFTSW